MISKRFSWKHHTNAQGMVEFALVLPILLLVIYGLMEVGRLIFTYSTVITAAREAARFGSANGLISGEPQYKDCSGILTAAENVDFMGVINPASITIQYDHGVGMVPFSSCPSDDVVSGDRIRVSITAAFTLIVPIVPLDPLPIHSASYRTILGKVVVTGDAVAPPGATILPPIITKSFLDNPISAGGDSRLQFTISNENSSDVLTGVRFTDTFPSAPSQMTRASIPDLYSTCGGTASYETNSVSLNGGSIAAGGTCTVRIKVNAPTDGTYQNSVQVLSDNGGAGNIFYANLIVGSSSSLLPPSISKTFLQNPIPAGANTTLQFTITNPNASVALAGVGFTDTFPAGMTKVTAPSAQCGGTVSSTTNSITLTGGSIAAGVGKTCTVKVRVTTSVPGPYANTSGNVTSSNAGNGNQASDTLVVSEAENIPPIVSKSFSPYSIKKSLPSTLTFFITNANAGTALTNIAFTDNFPAGMVLYDTPVSSQCNGTITGTAGGSSFNLTGGSLSAGLFTSCVITVHVTANNDGIYTNPSGLVTTNETAAIQWVPATLTVTNNPPPTCTFSAAARPTYNNVYPETVSWEINNTSSSNQVINRLVVFWDGGNLTHVTIDSASLFDGNEDPTTLSINGNGFTLTPGSHTIVFSYPSPFSIYGKNFNATLYFSASNCPIITTGSWTVQ